MDIQNLYRLISLSNEIRGYRAVHENSLAVYECRECEEQVDCRDDDSPLYHHALLHLLREDSLTEYFHPMGYINRYKEEQKAKKENDLRTIILYLVAEQLDQYNEGPYPLDYNWEKRCNNAEDILAEIRDRLTEEQ